MSGLGKPLVGRNGQTVPVTDGPNHWIGLQISGALADIEPVYVANERRIRLFPVSSVLVSTRTHVVTSVTQFVAISSQEGLAIVLGRKTSGCGEGSPSNHALPWAGSKTMMSDQTPAGFG